MADTKKPKTGGKGKPVATGRESVPVEEAGGFEQTISLFLAVGLIISALVVGLVVGYVVAPKGASTDLGVTAPTGGTAPSLTPDQLKSNQLPPSHPAVPGLTTGGATSQSAPPASTTGTAPTGQ